MTHDTPDSQQHDVEDPIGNAPDPEAEQDAEQQEVQEDDDPADDPDSRARDDDAIPADDDRLAEAAPRALGQEDAADVSLGDHTA